MANNQNMVEVEYVDGRRVCFSYGVPVAAYIPKDYALAHAFSVYGFVVTDRRYSVTTSKHMNAFAPKDQRGEVKDAAFRRIILPVEKAR